jgi:pilus assembly protein CpaF
MALNFGPMKDKNKQLLSEEPTGSSFEIEPEVVDTQTDSTFTAKGNPFLRVDKSFDEFFNDDDETEALDRVKNVTTPMHNYGSIELAIEKNIKDFRNKFPMGNYQSSQFITTEILLNATPGFFEKYDEILKTTVDFVQTMIADNNQASVIGEAQADPTNEEKCEAAYRIVQAATADYLDKHSMHRGVEKSIVMKMACDEIIGFSKLDPLWRDKDVDEILCNGPKDIQVEIKGKLYKVPGCTFRDANHLMTLIERLYGAIGKQVSRTTPIVDGRLHDNSRMAVVHTSVAPAGPNFSIRRHKEDFIAPSQLIEWGTAPPELLTFLGNLIYKGCSVLIIGGTGSGKTTLLGALTAYLRPDHRVITLEDNLELKLAPNKLIAAPMECIPGRSDAPGSGVSMRDLVKASLRQRPNAIIVGEVRDGSAWDLTQALNTGHYGMSTIHANNEYDGIYRLTSLVSLGGLMQGQDTLPLIAASFDVIVRIEKFPTDGSRKIVSVSEVAPFPEKRESGDVYLPVRRLWEFVDEGLSPDLKVKGHWEKVGEMGEERRMFRRLDLERDLTWEELTELSTNGKAPY